MTGQKHHWFIYIFSLCQWLLISDVFANNSITKTDVKNIEQLCLTSPNDCLKVVDQQLLATKSGSLVYFDLLQYRFGALFNLQQRELLYQETKNWLNQESIPLAFKVTVYIFYAKTTYFAGDKSESVKYYQLAKAHLSNINNAFPSPVRLVEFANLQMQLNENQAAFDLLMGMTKTYQRSKNPYFRLELHGNLGHAANRLKKLDIALEQWLIARDWAEELGNKQQLGVVLFNTADIYFQLKDHDNTRNYLQQAISMSIAANDLKKVNEAKYRLAENYIAIKENCLASTTLDEIDVKHLPIAYLPKLKELKDQQLKC